MTLLEIGQFKIALEIRHLKSADRVNFRKDLWDRYWERAIELLGTLRSNDATVTRTSHKKWICVLSVFIAIIPTHCVKCTWTLLKAWGNSEMDCWTLSVVFFLSFFLSFSLSFFLYLLRYIVYSIKVVLGIGNWQLSIEHLGIRNNVMTCLNDHQIIAS